MIKRFATKLARYHFLRQIRLRQHPAMEITPVLKLDNPYDATYKHGDIAFEVPLSHVRYPYLFSYGTQGWHPFVEVLKQYQKHPNLEYRDSILYRYYQNFHPQNVLDVFFAPQEQDVALKNSNFAKLSIPPYNPIFPWDPEISHSSGERGERGLSASHGHQGFGPVSDAKGNLELQRLTETLKSIKRLGYQPSYGHDGDIRGYFLRCPDSYRFIIRQGLHRTATLAALGYQNIRVKFYVHYPRVIFEHDAGSWPQVRQGFLDLDTSLRIFRKFFTEDGSQRAHRLGLLDHEEQVEQPMYE